jgi:hypothetical protein
VLGKDPDLNPAAPSPSSELVRSELNAILASRWFRSSQLQKQLLKFVVLKTLDGKADEIKEYAIGADAFGRGPDFDARIDSVVRVVARRVRDRLAEYYRNEGKADSVVIKLSVGSYIPSFCCQEEAKATTPVSASPPPPSSLAIALSGPGSQRHWMWITSDELLPSETGSRPADTAAARR